MKNVQSFLKKHRKKLIILVIVLILLFICFYAVMRIYKYLTPDTKESYYGDRCDITESIMITDERKNGVKDAIEAYPTMKMEDFDIKCNLIDIVVTVSDETTLTDVRKMANDIIAAFKEEELKFYELELMVDSDVEESETYPVIGKKRKMIDGTVIDHFVWE